MPPTPPRRAVTAVAVALAVLLALAWLRSADDGAPAVPTGLPVTPLPAVTTPTTSVEREQDAERSALEPRRAELAARKPRRPEPPAKRRHADRAGGGEDARARRQAGARTRRGTAGEAGGQDPPAAAPGPGTGSNPPRSALPATLQPAQPEFALG
jgi:hypothetical protein